MRNLDSNDPGRANPSSTEGRRRYIGIHFECCGVYTRIYRRPDQTAYLGRCPRCLRTVRVRVGRGGTKARVFRAR
ncbi:MAG: hypothetical protein IH986_05575 [Planctomycetes bacterium]|nr:hypothetical protein [Planctomycetota bacterium]